MSNYAPTPNDLLRSREALTAAVRYESEVNATPIGRKAHQMWIQGTKLSEDAQREYRAAGQEEAHKVFLEAVSLFSEGDNGPAAAQARYNLAESFKRRMIGVPRDNLLEALRLLNAAIASPARKGDPRRLALTHDGIGQVLRCLAPLRPNPQPEVARREAVRHIRTACEICEHIGCIGWIDAAAYYNNLGNALFDQSDLDAAIAAYKKASHFEKRVAANPELFATCPKIDGLRQQIALNLAGTYNTRNQKGDRLKSSELYQQTIHYGTEKQRNEARLALAEIAISTGTKTGRQKAQDELRMVDFWVMDVAFRRRAAAAFIELGDLETADVVVKHSLEIARTQRRGTMANHAADEASLEIQHFANLQADICLKRGDGLGVFLTFENSSAMRFHDFVTWHSRCPKDQVTRHLFTEHNKLSRAAADLDDLASVITFLAPSDVSAHLERVADEARQRNLHPRLSDAIDSAAHHLSPRAVLSTVAVELAAEVERLYSLIVSRDAAFDLSSYSWNSPTTRETLRDLVAEHPTTVFARIHLLNDRDPLRMVVAAVWRDTDNEMASYAAELKVAPALLDLAMKLAANESQSPYGDPSEFAMALETIDFADHLPRRGSNLVIFPSSLASLIPWAAAGRPGDTLLDRFESISYLPMLTPLIMRQAALNLRTGTLLVAPGRAPAAHPTHYHDIAFSDSYGEEQRLIGENATLEKVCSASKHADVISIYAHGQRGDDDAVLMSDGALTVGQLAEAVQGCERVELWACGSGVNLPRDFRIPLAVNEAFGFDISLLHSGARSTIGTLWSVPDLVTGAIVRKYRRGLASGVLPAKALADAQRWWRGFATTTLAQLIRSVPRTLLKPAIEQALDLPTSSNEPERTLGPINDDAPPTARQAADEIARYTSPQAWGGYRFLGVSERRPDLPANADRPLTPDEAEEVVQLLSARPAPPNTFDQHFQYLLDNARRQQDGASLSPEQAINVARLYLDRRESCHRHNVLRGLTWLHEAIATPTNKQVKKLYTEAAWLWLDLALAETRDARLLPLYGGSDERYRLRALDALQRGEDGAEQQIIMAWLDILAQPDPQAMQDAAKQSAAAAGQSARSLSPGSYEGLRARHAATELLLLSVPDDNAVSEWIQEFGSIDHASEANLRIAARLRAAVSALSLHVGCEVGPPKAYLLGHRDIARSLSWFHEGAANFGGHATIELRRVLNEHIGLVEGDYWGYFDDDRVPFWVSSGTPGRPWFDTMASYLNGKLRFDPSGEPAVHFIASLHMGADLRLGPLSNWVRFFGAAESNRQVPPAAVGPHWATIAIDTYLQQLEDAARHMSPTSAGQLIAHSRDAFIDSAAALLRAGADHWTNLTEWQMAQSLASWNAKPPNGITLAFAVEQAVSKLECHLAQVWPGQLDQIRKLGRDHAARTPQGEEPFDVLALLDPKQNLADAEEWLRNRSDDTVVFSLAIDPSGALMSAAVWRHAGRLEKRVHIGKPASGLQLKSYLCQCVGPVPDDWEPNNEVRSRLWSDVLRILQPTLDHVLGDAGDANRPPVLLIMAPGPLRSLPLLMCTVGDQSVGSQFSAAVNLPHLGFEQTMIPLGPPQPNANTVCTMGATANDLLQPFGFASIHTLRAVHGNTIATEPDRPTAGSLDELMLIDKFAADLRILRLYGTEAEFAQNPSLEGLRISPGRELSNRNWIGTLLPRCESVELWAATGRLGESRSIQDGDRDVMPSLVRSFFFAGAASVLDLAWPVPDLVKALVCEHYGYIRQASPTPGSVALRDAIMQVEHLLQWWHENGSRFSTLRDALLPIDKLRRQNIADLGINPAVLMPYSGITSLPAVEVKAYIAYHARAEHLAAFRWWGV